MDPYWLGLIMLVVLCFVPPTLKRIAQMKLVRDLRIEGAALLPRFWRGSLIRYQRSKWDADVRFTPPGEVTGGGQHGRFHWSGRLRRATPSIEVHPHSHGPAPTGVLSTGDARFDQAVVLTGDAGFAALLFGPEVRDVVLRLQGLSARLSSVRDGTVAVDGPLAGDVRQLLATCELLMDLMATAVSALPGKA